MIYIDFFGGTHGNFLEFLIAKHILQLPQYKNFYPFKESGVSHIKPLGPLKIMSSHFTYNDAHHYVNIHPDNLLIQIKVTPNILQDVFVYNAQQRAGEESTDFNLLVNNYKDALANKKFSVLRNDIAKEYGDWPSKRELRNIFYNKILEENEVKIHQQFKQFNLKTIIVPFESFYSYDLLLKELNNIAITLGNTLELDQIDNAWNKFMSLNEGYKIKLKIDSLFDHVINDISTPLSLNIFEEASLNSRITRGFNIHDSISIFDDNYPYNTQNISNDIKQIMNKRNSEFSLDLPIAKQLEKICLKF